MTVPPRDSSAWLRLTADLADRHRFETTTKAGSFLQIALIDFLRSGADEEADPLDLLADLITLLPRFHNALVAANHQGDPCRICASRYAGIIFNEIIQDIRELGERQAVERKH